MSNEPLECYSAQVLQNTVLVANIIELTLTRPTGFNWQAGDYLWLSPVGEENFKPFSIANQPTEDRLCLQIAIVPALESWLAQLFAVGDCQIKGPVSQYHWPEDHQKPIMMFAGGTGITPLLALLQGYQPYLKQQSVTLYWGVRQSELLFAKAALAELSTVYPLFQWQAIVSEQDPSWSGKKGLMPDVLMQEGVMLTQAQVLICGPWPMVQAIKHWVIEQGVLPTSIQ